MSSSPSSENYHEEGWRHPRSLFHLQCAVALPEGEFRIPEPRFYWILSNVAHDIGEMLPIPDQRVPVVRLPDRFAGDLPRGERFPSLYQFLQRCLRFEQQVDVIGHDDPREMHHLLALALHQYIFKQAAAFLFSQQARSASLIHPLLKSVRKSAVIFPLLHLLPRLRMDIEKNLSLLPPDLEFFGRDRVSQPEGHKLHHLILRPVREFPRPLVDGIIGIQEISRHRSGYALIPLYERRG
jgi:hypothetical protein